MAANLLGQDDLGAHICELSFRRSVWGQSLGIAYALSLRTFWVIKHWKWWKMDAAPLPMIKATPIPMIRTYTVSARIFALDRPRV